MSELVLKAGGCTDRGRVRERNEDAFLVDFERGLFVVADGMGGHRGGEVAAARVVELLPGAVMRRLAGATSGGDDDGVARDALLGAVRKVSDDVFREGKARIDLRGMGATVVAVLVVGCRAHVVHAGDSRAYLLRKGKLRLLTADHTVVQLLVQLGEITPEEAAVHPARSRLTRFVGMDEGCHADYASLDMEAGDRLLLCSDGLWGMVDDEVLRRILASRRRPDRVCGELVEAGLSGGGLDNITAVVIKAVRSA